MENKIVIGIVSAAIAIIVMAGVLMPALSSATETHETIHNEGYFYMDKITSEDSDYTAKWDHTAPNKITVNGETFDIMLDSTIVNNTSIILGDSFFLRYFPAQEYVGLYYDGVAIVYARASDNTDMIISYDGSTLVMSNTAETPVTRSITLSEFYSVSPSGDYVMKLSSASAYLHSDSEIYGSGRTSIVDDIVGTNVYGSVPDNISVSIWRGDVTASDIVVNAVQDNKYIDAYKFDSVDFTVTNNNDTSKTGEISYSFVVVPASVTFELSEHLDPTMNTLLNVIPIIVIIAILLGVVAFMIYNRSQ